ncbi:AAA family ATPase [Chitinophaga sp. Hz27]|uniref:AAA family ATPase n=1 Tax=Chitinophaga sp. Hz27 TaxID=3347169 RepID=UPI0035D8A66B
METGVFVMGKVIPRMDSFKIIFIETKQIIAYLHITHFITRKTNGNKKPFSTFMKILNIKIDGFANIDNLDLDLNKINALVAFNNYGKSNVLSAIQFATTFIQVPGKIRKEMMAFAGIIPINKNVDNKPFFFELTTEIKTKKEQYTVIYSFSFEWLKNGNKGCKIREEHLKIKVNDDAKFKQLIKRANQEAMYLPSVTGRCDKSILIDEEDLVLSKLLSFDELFYHEVLKAINNIRVVSADTLRDPASFYQTIGPKRIIKAEYDLSFPKDTETGFFLYSLMIKRKDLYQVFKNAVIALLPEVATFEPVEIDFKEKERIKKGIPLDLPDKLYEIIVIEKYNNQETSINFLSAGSQKIFYLLETVIAAELNNIPLLFFEEIENSIHPALLQKLLIILDSLTEHTRLIVTSHSPYLIKYLNLESIKIGLPNTKGTAQFKGIKKSKMSKLNKIASLYGLPMGDVIFDLMIDASRGESEILNEICT